MTEFSPWHTLKVLHLHFFSRSSRSKDGSFVANVGLCIQTGGGIDPNVGIPFSSRGHDVFHQETTIASVCFRDTVSGNVMGRNHYALRKSPTTMFFGKQ